MILVTGGTGLVGAHLLFRLCETQESVKAIYRTPESLEKTKILFKLKNASSILFDKIEWLQTDLSDIVTLEKALKDVTQVYHCAALVSFDPKDDKALFQTNVEGTANLVNLCIAKKIAKLCYVSSIAAIGSSIGSELATEETEWTQKKSTTTYALTKFLGELEIWRASQEGVPVVVVNPGVIFGAGFWSSGSNKFMAHALTAPKYYLPGGTGFVTVDDVVNAITLLMTSTITNERFILVNKNWTYKKLYEVLAGALNKTAPKNELKQWQINLLWRLDWVKSLFSTKPRLLSKAIATGLKQTTYYNNSKLQQLTDFKYSNLTTYLEALCKLYLSRK
jgi:dihydroflavonol-4-reductase